MSNLKQGMGAIAQLLIAFAFLVFGVLTVIGYGWRYWLWLTM